jgi:hypothetical protein
MRASLLTAAMLALLAGCASTRSTLLSDDTALVSVSGQVGTERTALVRQSLVEGARVAHAHGYHYFVVLAADDVKRVITRTVPGTNIFNASTSSRYYGNASPSPASRSGNSYSAADISFDETSPGLDITIRMYHEGTIDPAMDGVWNSETILGGGTSVK